MSLLSDTVINEEMDENSEQNLDNFSSLIYPLESIDAESENHKVNIFNNFNAIKILNDLQNTILHNLNNSNDKKRDLNYLRNFTFEIGSYKKNKKKKI